MARRLIKKTVSGFWSRCPDWIRTPGYEKILYGSLGAVVMGLLVVGIWRSTSIGKDEIQRVSFFRIAAGATGDTYFRMGELLSAVISQPPDGEPCEPGERCGVPGLVAVVKSSAGSVANARNISAGRFESGLVQANILEAAYYGTGPFSNEKPRKNLRVIGRLYPEAVHLVVRRGSAVASVEDLKNKVVSIGSRGSGTWSDALKIMRAYGLRNRDFTRVEENISRSAGMLLAGELDAFFLIAGAPAPLIETLLERDVADIISIKGEAAEKLRIENSFYGGFSIPAGVYPGTGPVETLGVGALWVTHEDVPAERIYNITRALFGPNNEATLASHPGGRFVRAETAVQDVPVLFHPGAERYYFETGILAR